MSDNPYQDDRGNMDRSIANPDGMGSMAPAEDQNDVAVPAPGGPFLIGEAMTGEIGRASCRERVCYVV